MNYSWNWGIYFESAPGGSLTYAHYLMQGIGWTLATALPAAAIALLLGALVGVARTLPSRPVAVLANAYVEIFRNIPLLVQMFLWFFVVPELVPQSLGQWMKTTEHASYLTAVVCLGFFTSARVAEQVRSGICALPKGQPNAALALGFSLWQTYRIVLLPQAFRMIVPPLASEAVNIVKNTSVALTIGLMELTARTRTMQEMSFQVFEAFTAATVGYLLINACVSYAMARVERRYPQAPRRVPTLPIARLVVAGSAA